MKAETLLETPARAQMRKRDPGVLLVPDNRWDGAEGEYTKQQVQTGPRKLLSEPGSQCEYEQN